MSDTLESCPHVEALFAAEDDASSSLSIYKSVLGWSVSRFQGVKNPAKRRKVSGRQTVYPAPLIRVRSRRRHVERAK